jgi:hypothetical protein
MGHGAKQRIASPVAVAFMFVSTPAWAGPPAGPDEAGAPAALGAGRPPTDTGTYPSERPSPEDPTGGAYTTPTLLFVPASAVPTWNVRVIASTELQSPSDVHAGFRPGMGGEVGLPAGFTIGAGTNWVGGDINPGTGRTDVSLGLSPYFQGRFHILGDSDGRGFQLGTSATYKLVGFAGDPGEAELALSAQYRMARYELGLQAVLGKDFGSADADAEAHAYALYRVIPQLGVGAAGQARRTLVSQPGESSYDVIGGAIASLTLGHYQVGALAGASTLGLAQGHAGGLGQLFATARF